MRRVVVVSLGLVILSTAILGSCTSGSSSSSRTGGAKRGVSGTINTDTGDPEAPVVALTSISGDVTSTTEQVGQLQVSAALRLLLLTDSSDCAAGTFSVHAIGGGTDAAALVQDQAFTSGSFSMSVPVTSEVVVTFSCSEGESIRCLAKPGDTGILCNAVADSVLRAFETALGKSITDTSFAGQRVSKVGASIVEAAKVSSDEVDAFKTDIAACQLTGGDGLAACYRTAIEASPFKAPFKIMRQMAEGWTVEGLFVFVTDILGLKIRIDSDLYSELMTQLGISLGTSFITDTRALLSAVVTAQTAKLDSYPFRVQCEVNISGKSSSFDPAIGTVNGMTGIVCDSTQAATILRLNGFLEADITSITGGAHSPPEGWTCSSGESTHCWVDIGMTAVSNNSEKDRNDPTGVKRSFNDRYIGLVDVMPQVIKALSDEGLTVPQDGPPVITTADQMAKAQRALTRTKDYFVGMIGIYRFLNDSAMRGVTLSLTDIHDIFVGEKLMRNRVVGFGPFYNGLSTTDTHSHYPPILRYDSANQRWVAPNLFKTATPGMTPSGTQAQVNTLFAQTEPAMDATFGMFTTIPNSREIERFVFSSSHHEEWNPMGTRYLYVAQLASAGIPIACKINNPGTNFTLTSTSTVLCDAVGTGVSCDSDGVCAFPADYAYPFLLFERGWFGDSKGRLFALGSRKTGRELGMMGGSRGIMVKEYKEGNAAGACDGGQIGTVINYVEEVWCGASKCKENVRAFCMNMSTLGTPARARFYPGGTYTVRGTDPSGNSWSWDVPLIGHHLTSSTDFSKDGGACLDVASGTFVAPGAMLATLNIDGATGAVTSLPMGAAVKSCSGTFTGKKYYLYQWKDATSAENLSAYLLDSSDNSTLRFAWNPQTGQPWESTYVTLSKALIDSKLNASYSVAGSATTQINGMKYVNPLHDSKFDPYCDDVNGNGACDCYAVASLSADRKTVTYASNVRSDPKECGLMDKAAEPTLSELPYCRECSDTGSRAELFLDTFGGKSGADLADAYAFLTEGGQPQVMMDFQRVTLCLNKFSGESKRRSPLWINWQHWDQAQQGCPATEGAVRTASNPSADSGPIRIMKLRPMNNAFNVGRPHTMIKLMNYATKTVGQGVTLAADSKQFTLDEAMTLIMLRTALPPNLGGGVYNEAGDPIRGFNGFFESVREPTSWGDPFSGLLKGILFKAGKVTEADLSYQFGP